MKAAGLLQFHESSEFAAQHAQHPQPMICDIFGKAVRFGGVEDGHLPVSRLFFIAGFDLGAAVIGGIDMTAQIAIALEPERFRWVKARLDQIVRAVAPDLATVAGSPRNLEHIAAEADAARPSVPLRRDDHLHVHRLSDMDDIFLDQRV